jgi:uncharacterized membrane protein YhaH (DUF805 family)
MSKLLSMDGRLSRGPYFGLSLSIIVGVGVVQISATYPMTERVDDVSPVALLVVTGVGLIATYLPLAMITVRRLHDPDRPGSHSGCS